MTPHRSFGAIVLEQRILRWAANRDRLFPPIPVSNLLGEIRLPLSWPRLSHLQAMRDYLRSRRAAYYTLWIWQRGSVDSQCGAQMATTLLTLGLSAGLPLERAMNQAPPPEETAQSLATV